MDTQEMTPPLEKIFLKKQVMSHVKRSAKNIKKSWDAVLPRIPFSMAMLVYRSVYICTTSIVFSFNHAP